MAKGVTEGGEVHGREGEGPLFLNTEGGGSGDRVAVLGEHGIECVEKLVVVEGENLTFEGRPALGGEVVETPEVERVLLADLGARADSSNNHPVVVSTVWEAGQVDISL